MSFSDVLVFIINISKYGSLICAYWMHQLINLMIKNLMQYEKQTVLYSVSCLPTNIKNKQSALQVNYQEMVLYYADLTCFLSLCLYLLFCLIHTNTHKHTRIHL